MSLSIQIAPGLYRIPLVPMDLVNAFALRDDDGQVTLIDAGVKWSPSRIIAALAEIGAAPEDVTTIVATHSHMDHIGGLRGVADRTVAEVAVHADDADDVRLGRGAPVDPASWLGRLRTRQLGVEAVAVDRELADGDMLAVGGGVQVVHTPGHTPGHISLLHRASQTLVTGDAIWNMNSRRTWPVLAFCSDGRMTQQTASRLGDLEYRTAAFTHGPEIRDSGRDAVRSFLARPRAFRMLV